MKKLILTLGLIAGLNSLYAEDVGDSDKIQLLNSELEKAKAKNNDLSVKTVSYTHLTLPTILLV